MKKLITGIITVFAILLFNTFSSGLHASAMPMNSHEMGGMNHETSSSESCATLCRTAVINKEEILNLELDAENNEPTVPATKPKDEFYNRDMRESVLVYFDKLTLGSVPAEITLKSGQVKPTSLPVLSGEVHPLLRVFIPMRDNDDSVPKFVRNYDFKFGDGKHIPKVQKDSRGRKIRRTD